VPGHVSQTMHAAPLLGRMPSSEKLSIIVGLRPKGDLESAALAVSDPSSPRYRQFITPVQFGEEFGASAEEYAKVLDWAKRRGLDVTPNPNRLVVEARGLVSDIESALHVKLEMRARVDGSAFYAPDKEPVLDLDVPVSRISNLDNHVAPKHSAGSGPDGSRFGFDFRQAYASCSGLRGAGQKVGILMMDDFNAGDLNLYATMTAQPPPLPVQSIPPGRGMNANPEGNLDVQMAFAMAPDAQIITFYDATSMNAILTNMANRPDVKQLSSSWTQVIDSTTHTLMAQLALQGQSFFEASGDAGSLAPGYFSGDTDLRLLPTVTNVGGTEISLSSGGSYLGESAWSGSSGTVLSFQYGGGIPIPSYQVGLSSLANKASSAYRNMPDVSAEAGAAAVVINGSLVNVGGTSASAPLWAGFMALVNQRSSNIGKPSVGFANPALYQLARSAYGTHFNDVTTGAAPGDGTNFPVVPGYDLITGLGSPNTTARC
jgi:subtilase family serine protease